MQQVRRVLVPFYDDIFQKLGIRLPLTNFEKEVFDHRCILPSQFYLVSWDFLRVLQYLYEYQGDMGSDSKNLFVHLFNVNPHSKKEYGYNLVSLHLSNYSLSCLYREMEKVQKELLLSHSHFTSCSCGILCSSDPFFSVGHMC